MKTIKRAGWAILGVFLCLVLIVGVTVAYGVLVGGL